MKTKKYQFYNRFLVGDPVTERNIFAFREFKKTACWIMVNPMDVHSEPENCRLDLDQILGDFARNPTLSEKRLRQYLTLIRKGLKNSTNSPSPPPDMLMMVTDYSRIVWAIAGNLRICRVRNGNLKFEDDKWRFMNCLGINFKSGEVRSDSAFLKDNDLIFMCDAETGKKISDESIESVRHFLINASQDPDYRMAFISVSKVKKRDLGHDLKDCKRTEVMIPVLLMACFGMLAIYEIETQKLKHALFIPKAIAAHHQQLTDRKNATVIALQEIKKVEPSGPNTAITDQSADNGTSAQSSTLMVESIAEVLPQTVPSKDNAEAVPGKEQSLTTAQVKPLVSIEKAKSESTPKHSAPVSKTGTPVSRSEDKAAMLKAVTDSDDLKNGPAWGDTSDSDNSVEQSDLKMPEYQSKPEWQPDSSEGTFASDLNNELPEESVEYPKSNKGDFVDKKDSTNQIQQSRVDLQKQSIPNDATEHSNAEQTGETSKSNVVTVIE